jgi:hypothetical protein
MLPQVVNQYLLLVLPTVVLAGWGIALACRRSALRWWGVWAGCCLLAGGGFLALRTPAATLLHPRPAETVLREGTEGTEGTEETELPNLKSVAEIRSCIAASGGRPTLVEFYTDLGFG